jgi:hypothetical protein
LRRGFFFLSPSLFLLLQHFERVDTLPGMLPFPRRLRVCCAARFGFPSSHIARALRHTRRRACAFALEVGRHTVLLNNASSSSSSSPLPSSTVGVHAPPCSSQAGNAEVAEWRGTTDAANVSHISKKVHLSSTNFNHLAPHHTTHLVQMERLLLRRVPQSRDAILSMSSSSEERDNINTAATSVHRGHGCSTASAAAHGELFVMSRVVARPTDPSPLQVSSAASVLDADSSSHMCLFTEAHVHAEVYTGVNHAFHKHVNPGGATLRGILKGCAEQNALGAAAASGCAYADITDVYVLATRVWLHDSKEQRADDVMSPGGQRGANGLVMTHDASLFPCPECWRHLCHVARVRHQQRRPPLRLFVCASSSSTAVHLLSLVQQRVAVMEEPMQVFIVVR